jgi:hypothetical protein
MKIDTAESEARRFLAACEALRQRRSTDDMMLKYEGICGFKEVAAVRRASMDLTRALTDMRKVRP